MHQVLAYLLERLKEKSTWVSIGSFLTAIGVGISPENWQLVMMVGMGLPGLVTMFLPARVQEKGVIPSLEATPLSKGIEEKKQ